jgi:putative tricarboxylic transport membrane protein
MLLIVNIFFIPAFASIARVPFRILGPIILVVCVVGTFTVNGSIIEVGIMLACGLLGFFMRRYGMSPAALVIALVLGPLAEETLRQTMIVSRGDMMIFFHRSTSVWLLVIIGLLLLLPLLGPLLKRIVRVRVREVGRRRRQHEREEARAAGTRPDPQGAEPTEAAEGGAHVDEREEQKERS